MCNNETNYIPFPEEYGRRKLNALYREIPLKDTTSRLLRKYFNAAANLYGIIPLRKLYEIITSQNRALLTEKEFLAFAEIAKHECEDYRILGEADLYCDGSKTPLMEYEVIDISLIDEGLVTYHQVKQGHQGKPYYVPPKKEFLAYDNAFYWEPTRQALAFRDWLMTGTALAEDELDAVFAEIYYAVHCMGIDLQDVMLRLNKIGVTFDRKCDVNAFSKVYMEFNNNVRMQYNRGHTPSEIAGMFPPEDRVPESISLGPNIRQAIADGQIDPDELRKGILTIDVPNEELRFQLLKEIASAEAAAKPKKVGRNDPCPCGSGKKYKKCCGR